MFSPVIPTSGVSGWLFLQRTYDTQMAVFTQSQEVSRSTTYFADHIGNVNTAEDLVSDRRLLEVALGAFGLQDDVDNRYFIKKMLEDGTSNPDALANRFADKRYAALSAEFGLGPKEVNNTGSPGFAQRLIEKYEANSFEIATGAQDDNMRIALYAQRALSDIASGDSSNNTKWFSIMGEPPLRTLFEKSLNLPSSFGQIDIDQQLEVFKERSASVFGSNDVSQFTDSAAIDKVINRFMAGVQLESIGAGASSASIALTLLGG